MEATRLFALSGSEAVVIGEDRVRRTGKRKKKEGGRDIRGLEKRLKASPTIQIVDTRRDRERPRNARRERVRETTKTRRVRKRRRRRDGGSSVKVAGREKTRKQTRRRERRERRRRRRKRRRRRRRKTRKGRRRREAGESAWTTAMRGKVGRTGTRRRRRSKRKEVPCSCLEVCREKSRTSLISPVCCWSPAEKEEISEKTSIFLVLHFVLLSLLGRQVLPPCPRWRVGRGWRERRHRVCNGEEKFSRSLRFPR